MKKLTIQLILLGSTLVSGTAFAAKVTNGANDGAGSLRAALASGSKNISISNSVRTITVTESLEYGGTKKLNLLGTGQVIDGSGIVGDGDVFSITMGADADISNLSFVGNAGIVNEDPNVPVGGKGIDVNIPSWQTGKVKLTLSNVSVTRVGNHGVHVSDCSLGDDCGSGSGGGGEGSPASIEVNLNKVLINGVGFGKADADGVRVDDRGDGSIFFNVRNSTFINVGADGVELDEGNNGDVVADVRSSLFDSNGEYCNLIPVYVGGPCDDDGDRDVDDGFDIDEAGPGSLLVRVANSKITNNFDEGLDFDEEDEGGIEAIVTRVYAAGNQDEGVKISEEDEGGIDASLRSLTTVDNNGRKEGVEIEEEDAGDVSIVVKKQTNMIGGEDEKLKAEQSDGVGTIKVIDSNVTLDLDGF